MEIQRHKSHFYSLLANIFFDTVEFVFSISLYKAGKYNIRYVIEFVKQFDLKAISNLPPLTQVDYLTAEAAN